jgi:hypothetical protein
MEAMVRVLSQKAIKGDQKALSALVAFAREANLVSDPKTAYQPLIGIPIRAATVEEWKRAHGGPHGSPLEDDPKIT